MKTTKFLNKNTLISKKNYHFWTKMTIFDFLTEKYREIIPYHFCNEDRFYFGPFSLIGKSYWNSTVFYCTVRFIIFKGPFKARFFEVSIKLISSK